MEIGLAKSILGKWQKKLMMELKKKRVDDGIDFCKKYYVMLQADSSKMEDNLEVFYSFCCTNESIIFFLMLNRFTKSSIQLGFCGNGQGIKALL